MTEDTAQYYSLFQVQALAGGNVQIPALTTISGGPVILQSDGAGSKLDVSALTNFQGTSGKNTYASLQATHSGTVLDPSLTTMDHANLTLDGTGTIALAQLATFTVGTFALSGGTASLSGLTDADGSSFVVSAGSTLTLGALASYAGGVNYTSTFQATGAGSVLALPKLATVTADTAQYYSLFQVQALAGGNVQIPALTTISGGPVILQSDGTGSKLDVSALSSFKGTSGKNNYANLQATHSGTVLDPSLTTMDHANLTLDGTGTIALAQLATFTVGTFALSGGTASLSGLTNADGSSFVVSAGSTLTLGAGELRRRRQLHVHVPGNRRRQRAGVTEAGDRDRGHGAVLLAVPGPGAGRW